MTNVAFFQKTSNFYIQCFNDFSPKEIDFMLTIFQIPDAINTIF